MIPTSDALLNAPPARGKVTHALISVFDKSNLETLAKGLHEKGVVLLSSGGTAKHIASLGIPVTEVSAFTQADEVLGGRVKTLHPKIHAGILADRREESHLQDLKKRNYVPIDLVVCNLYPFEQAAATYTNEQQIIENIDIGGPTMVRAAAKNAIGGVTIIVDPQDYGCVMDSLGEQATIDYTLRRELAKKAFGIITQYDQAISSWYL
ncbi:uncharacterized protein METZ01_LOCUS419502, partial [marine metagenome]